MSTEEIAAVQGNAGVSMLNDLIGAEKNYLYEAGTKETARDRETGEVLESEENSALGQSYMIRNLLKTERNVDGGSGGVDFTVAKEKRPGVTYDGHVRISNAPGYFYQAYTDGTERTIKRASVVFHELAENYERTTNSQPYERRNGSGAHNNAVIREGGAFGNNHPGNARYKKK